MSKAQKTSGNFIREGRAITPHYNNAHCFLSENWVFESCNMYWV